MPAPTDAVVARPSRALARVDTDKLREQLLPRLPDLLPSTYGSVDRFIALTMQALAKSPELYDCEPTSVLMACLEIAQVGLEPTGSIGGAHLVSFKEKDGPKKCQVIYDYRGLQHLVRMGGGGEVKAVLVFEDDVFKVYEGTNPHIEHEPAYTTNDPTKIRFVYAWPLDHPEKFEVMTKEQIDLIRASSRLRNGIPWTQHYGQQARKSSIRRLVNYLDLRPATRGLIERDTEREFGEGVAQEPIVTRAARVRERLAARKAPHIGPGAPEEAETAQTAPPPESASQQPENADQAVCGAPNAEGDAWCVKPIAHDGGHDGPHASADGALVWPQEALP